MKTSTNVARQAWVPWVTTLALLVLWQIVAMVLGSASLMLPAPTAIAQSIGQHYDVIWPNALQTLYTTGLGFGLAVALGMVFGLAIGASSLIYRGVYPLLIAFNAVPKVALVPIFVLWFGIGTLPAVVTAFSLAVFPIIVNVATGLSTIDAEMEDVMRSLGATRWDILTKVGIPRMAPYLFASLKIAITLAFVGSVLSETIASNEGIGFLMQAASSRFDVPLVFAGVIVIAAMAVIAYQLCEVIEGRFTHWAKRGK
ncbi:ABC transporter permease [Pseudomonas typographi]|uniref:ABC transporter permease n=1 Tax=Pseudomonas typographi TaxID=2715964 RepID=A0ABR7Z484_9PSED|nr:ABC transporter permease [Pseudomonas typographi]MBD1552032.1 ABC transporter permease [Pseudomonas typographi]MBD1586595.1 ABC transporter permease [Pseudomonas typographi]MBD1600096.1 ABC transporter permease [Pseudomonas typographi]